MTDPIDALVEEARQHFYLGEGVSKRRSIDAVGRDLLNAITQLRQERDEARTEAKRWKWEATFRN